MTAVPTERWRPGPAVFAGAVAAHLLLLQWLGTSFVIHPSLDANIYLELAQNLWREGRFETGLGKLYPPGYPLLIAPLFAVESNELRFALIYLLHGLLLAGGTLAIKPLVTELAGDRKAWIAMSAAQFLAGATIHAIHPRTEALFTALLLVATALVHRLARRPGWRPAFLLGVVLGAMVATRRTGLAFIAAAVVLFAFRLLRARRDGGLAQEGQLTAFALLGGLAGWSPELLVTLLEAEWIRPYSEGVVESHLGAGVRALESGKSRSIALRAAAQHAVYYPLSSLGLALTFPMVLMSRRRRIELPPGVRQTVGFVIAGAVFLAGLSTLHVVRFWFRRDLEKGYDLYPRYLDPLEPVWLLVGFGLACVLMREDRLRRFAPWAAAMAIAAVLSERVVFPRGYRLPWADAITSLGWPFDPDSYFLFQCGAVLLVLTALVWRGLLSRPWIPLTAVLLTWGLSAHLVQRWVESPQQLRVPEVLRTDPLGASPTADLLVVLPAEASRGDFYKLAFRTNHRVRFLPRSRLGAWMEEHPGGFVVVRKRDRIRVDRPLLSEARGWLVYAAAPD